MATDEKGADEHEGELQSLLNQERFDPPEDFVRHALVRDDSLHRDAERDPAAFWLEQARELDWFTDPSESLDNSNAPFFKWFADGKINASHNCLDRHVEAGNGDRVAFHWRGEEGEEEDWTYADLLRDVQKLANGLKQRGIGREDVVGIFLPMIPEVVIAMLACARIGAVHNLVFGGFSPESVSERMKVSEARALVTVDGARRKGKTAEVKSTVDEEGIGDLDHMETIVVVGRTGAGCAMTEGRDLWYHELLEAADDECPAEELDSEHPLFILYTSGSTGKPKGVLHTTGGYLVYASMTHQYVFDYHDGDVYWCTADIGWVTGHSYIVYGPLANGATTLMFEGVPNYPTVSRFWEVVDKHGVNIFYTAPTAIRALMGAGDAPVRKASRASLRLLGSVGEPINPEAWEWYFRVVGDSRCPVVDTWWQTETGGIMISPLPGATTLKPGSATFPLPGVSAEVVDEQGRPVDQGGGYLTLTRPWPGMLRGIYGDPDRYRSTYWTRFAGRYFAGDGARVDEDGYYWFMGRVDDVMNVSGHRVSTTEVESALVDHPTVAEAACVGAKDETTGQAIIAYVTCKGGVDDTPAHGEALRRHVTKRIGPIARPKTIIFTEELPKTRSGKIMRRLLRDVAEGRDLGDTTTLADASVVEEIRMRASTGSDEE